MYESFRRRLSTVVTTNIQIQSGQIRRSRCVDFICETQCASSVVSCDGPKSFEVFESLLLPFFDNTRGFWAMGSIKHLLEERTVSVNFLHCREIWSHRRKVLPALSAFAAFGATYASAVTSWFSVGSDCPQPAFSIISLQPELIHSLATREILQFDLGLVNPADLSALLCKRYSRRRRQVRQWRVVRLNHFDANIFKAVKLRLGSSASLSMSDAVFDLWSRLNSMIKCEI